MRKIMLIVLLLSPLFMAGSCEKFPTPDSSSLWRIKNSTGQTLRITVPPRSLIVTYPVSDPIDNRIVPEHPIALMLRDIYDGPVPPFDSLLDVWNNLTEEDMFFEVFSNEGLLLARWNYSDKDMPGRQFFNESSWQYHEEIGGEGEIKATWTFEILPEDISSTQP
jgi:hypothetical protein